MRDRTHDQLIKSPLLYQLSFNDPLVTALAFAAEEQLTEETNCAEAEYVCQGYGEIFWGNHESLPDVLGSGCVGAFRPLFGLIC